GPPRALGAVGSCVRSGTALERHGRRSAPARTTVPTGRRLIGPLWTYRSPIRPPGTPSPRRVPTRTPRPRRVRPVAAPTGPAVTGTRPPDRRAQARVFPTASP